MIDIWDRFPHEQEHHRDEEERLLQILFCITFLWQLNVLSVSSVWYKTQTIPTLAIDTQHFCQLEFKKKALVSPNPKVNTAIYRWKGKHAFTLCSSKQNFYRFHGQNGISTAVNTASHESSFLLFLVLTWKIHILENCNMMLLWSRFCLLKPTSVNLNIFEKPPWYPNCGFSFSQLVPDPFYSLLSACFSKNMVCSQRVKTEVSGSTVAWKTICQEIKKIKNTRGLLFWRDLSFSELHSIVTCLSFQIKRVDWQEVEGSITQTALFHRPRFHLPGQG